MEVKSAAVFPMKSVAMVLCTVANPKAGPKSGEDAKSSQNPRFFLSRVAWSPKSG